MPTRTPRSRGAGRWGRVGLSGPGTHPLLPHRSNIVPSRVAPPPGARCHQNHPTGTNLYGKNKKCARGHRTPGPNCPQSGETVVSAPRPGGRRGGRKRGAEASGRALFPGAVGAGPRCCSALPRARGRVTRRSRAGARQGHPAHAWAHATDAGVAGARSRARAGGRPPVPLCGHLVVAPHIAFSRRTSGPTHICCDGTDLWLPGR